MSSLNDSSLFGDLKFIQMYFWYCKNRLEKCTESSKINNMTKIWAYGWLHISGPFLLLAFQANIVISPKLRFFFSKFFSLLFLRILEPYLLHFLPCFCKICPIFNHSSRKHFFLSWEMIVIECIPCIGNRYSKHIRQFRSMCRSNMKLKK